jgi:hypothetical protein
MLCGMCSAVGMADMEIFIDFPAGLWDFVSDGPLDKANTEQVHSYQKAVKVQLASGQQATMFHTWYGEYTQNVEKLGFWVYCDTTAFNNVKFQARIRNEAPRPEIRIGDFVNVPADEWTYVELPLQSFNVTPGEQLHYMYFKAQSNVRFWIDDAKLITRTPPLLTSIVINQNNTLAEVSRRSFGAGVMAANMGFEQDPQTWSLLREAGLTFFNFPGGVNVEYYDWRSSTNTSTGAVFRVDTADYINSLAQVGADGMISTNYGSATPQDSADWVQHANVTLGGSIKYWSLGNEPYQPGAHDIRPSPYRHDADTYAQFCVEAIALMKAVDPTIKVGMSITPNENSFAQRFFVTNPRTGQQVNGWAAVLLTRMREANVYPDYLDFHLYTMAPGKESDAVAFQMLDRLDFWIGGIKQMLEDYWDGEHENTPIHLTESNSVFGEQGKISVSLTNALYLANQWGAMHIRGVQSHVWWNVYEAYRTVGNYHEMLYGWRNYTDRGLLAAGWPVGAPIPYNTPHPTYFAMRILDQFADPGDQIVDCTSNNLLLKTYAVKSPTGRVRLMVINISKDVDYTASISGTWFPQFVTIHRYGIPQDLTQGDFTTQVGYGGAPVFASGARTFNARFNRYSISVIEF